MHLQIDCLDWENWGPDIPERKADAKKKDPKKCSRKKKVKLLNRGKIPGVRKILDPNARDPQGPGH